MEKNKCFHMMANVEKIGANRGFMFLKQIEET